jgi:hypothetical protein
VPFASNPKFKENDVTCFFMQSASSRDFCLIIVLVLREINKTALFWLFQTTVKPVK